MWNRPMVTSKAPARLTAIPVPPVGGSRVEMFVGVGFGVGDDGEPDTEMLTEQPEVTAVVPPPDPTIWSVAV